MIAITRTASIAPGKASNAMAYAHQVAKYIKEKRVKTLEVLMPMVGIPRALHGTSAMRAWRNGRL